MRIIVVGPLANGNEFHVHRADCGSLRNSEYRPFDRYEFEAKSREQVGNAIYPPYEFDLEPGEAIEYLTFKPCTRSLKRSHKDQSE